MKLQDINHPEDLLYHYGNIRNLSTKRLIHVGTFEAARSRAFQKGELYCTSARPRNPIIMIDTGYNHDIVFIAEGIMEANNDLQIRSLMQEVIGYAKSHGPQAAEARLISGLKLYGYDGIVYENTAESPGSTSYILFDAADTFSVS